MALAGDLVHRAQGQRAQNRWPIEAINPLHGAAHCPPSPDGIHRQPECAALVMRTVPEVIAHHPGTNCLEERMLSECGLPLNLAEVRAASHADIPVAPVLLAYPVERVISIFGFRTPRNEL